MSARIDPGTVKTEKWPATVSRIAVGVGGYPEGKDAVVLAAAIARATQAELLLVAVHPYPLVVLPEEMNWKSLEKQAATMLAEVRDSLAPDARMVVEHRDLLVVGSSRHGPDGWVRIGKRSRQLLCHFKCALAIAPRGMHSRPLQELRRIGVGYDGGPESEAALSLAGSIAVAAGAELHLCGVVDDRLPSIGWSALATGGAAVSRWEDAVLAQTASLRELALDRTKGIAANTHAEVLRGRPADALLKLSAETDLLVIGSRRWGAVARLLLGSTGEALAHDAACPLLVVPRPAGLKLHP